MQVLNFYSTIFADQLKRGRKTATIRLGDKSHKYRKNQAVLVTIGYQHSPREKIFDAVIDQVEVKRVKDLTPRDIEHDNPEFRRHEEMIHFLEQIYGKTVTMDDIVTVVRFSQIIENPPGVDRAPARHRRRAELAPPSSRRAEERDYAFLSDAVSRPRLRGSGPKLRLALLCSRVPTAVDTPRERA